MNLMTISGNSGITAAQAGAPVKPVTAAGAAKAAANAIPKPSTRPLASISKGAEMMKALDQLKASDPGKLKAVADDMATKLKAEAEKQGGAAGHALSQLATKFAAAAKTGDLSAFTPASQSASAHRSAPATGAAAYADNAKRGALAIDVKQVVEDVKKAADTSTGTGAKAAEVATRPTPVHAAAAQGKYRAGAAGGGADNAERGAMAIDVKQVVEDVKKAADKSTNTGARGAEQATSSARAAAAPGKFRAGGGADNADRGVMGIDIKQVVEDVKKAASAIKE
jgi:hypothetical protein